MIKRITLLNWLALASVFFTFFGQKVILLIIAFFGSLSISRYFTISIRLSIGLMLALMLLIQLKKMTLKKEAMLFILFCIPMGVNIFLDISNGNYNKYYLSNQEVIGYFILFCILPFIAIINSKISSNAFDKMINSFILSGFLFSSLSVIIFRKYIGNIGRLSNNSSGDENILSPLILSYSSGLIIVLGITFLLFNKVRFTKRVFILSIIAISTIPFFMGSTRGSVLSIAGSFLAIIIFGVKSGSKIKILAIFSSIVGFGFFVMNSIQSNLLLRMEKVEDLNDSNERILRYLESIDIIYKNPLFGNGLVLNSFDNYPHNIILEVIQTSGIIGFIPFATLIFFGFNSARRIISKHPKNSWVAILFIQCFFGNMLSGSIITASWFWISLALVISYDNQFLKSKLTL